MRPKAMKSMSTLRLKTSRVIDSSRLSEHARRVSATAIILFALWSGGFGCLWCCVSNLPEGCCDKRSAARIHNQEQACSAHRPCCESTESNQRAAIKDASQTAAAHCCPTGAHSSGPAVFPASQQRQALALTISHAPTPVAFTLAAPPLVSHAPPANKGSTYLRCCVLLI
ncbi:MAG: hypothetical protein V7641_4990 [Blastocatellia bacterium]